MKQFGKILKFELKGYLRNKIFVGITVFLVVAIAIVMFIPNIVASFESDGEGEVTVTDLPVMLLYAEDKDLRATVKEYFSAAFVDYNVKLAEGSVDQLKNDVISGNAECAFVHLRR